MTINWERFGNLTAADEVVVAGACGVVDHFCGGVGALVVVIDIDTFVTLVKI